MRYIILVILASAILNSCNKDASNPLVQNNNYNDSDTITGLDITNKLKQWSNMQPQKFVICELGDTSNGKLYDVGDLITNLEFNNSTFNWVFTDSLHIDSTRTAGMDHIYSAEQLKAAYDSLSLSFTENQMTVYLSGLEYKLRMMEFDSLTNDLDIKLLEWAAHQYPPQIIWSGFHTFVYEGPNSGGYSPAVYTYRGVQNLQYFTRKVSQAVLQNTLTRIDTSLSFSELYDIMLPIAEIKIHDTRFYED